MTPEIEKFPYGIGSGLSETEAKENFVNVWKKYGPLTLRIGLFALMMSSYVFAADTPTPGTTGNQCAPSPGPNVLLAFQLEKKSWELLLLVLSVQLQQLVQ